MSRANARAILAGVRAAVAIVVMVASLAGAADGRAGAATYRSERFGWTVTCPPGVAVRAYFDGQSADLIGVRSQRSLATLEVWPGDLCPRERPGTTAEALGVERLEAVTQIDGDDESSVCGAPLTLRRFTSDHGVPLYEATLACTRDRRVGRRTVHSRAGRKGPTFFADVSQPWRTRVLMIDPAGTDPRMDPTPGPDPATVREILDTLVTFPVPDPRVVCIEDLGPVSGAAASAPAPTPR